ncbi:MAG: hypothetical protein ACYSU0_19580, partial [Planctomycetota bacterium]
GLAKPEQNVPDEMKGFYGPIEGKVLSATKKGFILLVTAVRPWRDNEAKAARTVKGKRLLIAFRKVDREKPFCPVQRYYILRRVRAGQRVELAVHDNRRGDLNILAFSRTQQGLPGRGRGKQWPYNPVAYHSERDQSVFCENGILRVRTSHYGIIWFDFYHPTERKWYLQKNNMNLMTMVGRKWNNTEGDEIIPRVEIMSEGGEELRLRYHFIFPNGAKCYADLSMRKGEPEVTFSIHSEPDSKTISGYQWHITNGQSEAVARLEFDKEKILAKDLPLPFPGARLKVQKVQRYRNLKERVFRFSGDETSRPDPKNPFWMGRVLGMKQQVTWAKPMRGKDSFGFEARDQPWQPTWQVPSTIPWFEGLWFIRHPFLEGDTLTYRIDNFKDFLRGRTRAGRR